MDITRNRPLFADTPVQDGAEDPWYSPSHVLNNHREGLLRQAMHSRRLITSGAEDGVDSPLVNAVRTVEYLQEALDLGALANEMRSVEEQLNERRQAEAERERLRAYEAGREEGRAEVRHYRNPFLVATAARIVTENDDVLARAGWAASWVHEFTDSKSNKAMIRLYGEVTGTVLKGDEAVEIRADGDQFTIGLDRLTFAADMAHLVASQPKDEGSRVLESEGTHLSDLGTFVISDVRGAVTNLGVGLGENDGVQIRVRAEDGTTVQVTISQQDWAHLDADVRTLFAQRHLGLA